MDRGQISNEQKLAPNQMPPGPTSYLAGEHQEWRRLLEAQPVLIQRFFEAQAHKLAEALDEHVSPIRLNLPDQVVVELPKTGKTVGLSLSIPANERELLIGGILDRLMRTDLHVMVRQRLTELEASQNKAVATSAGLLRYSTARFMIYNLLPSGRSIQYQSASAEEIPSIPVSEQGSQTSAITAATDAIVERDETGEELLVPYVPYARSFYLPQWVAFNGDEHLLVNSTQEAQAHIASMQKFLKILHNAVSLAAYMVTDETYQQKRYGMLGQLLNQARTLTRYQTREIIETIQRRAASHDLNRGLSVSLPFFDDQSLEIKLYPFEIIPAGRIMFVPAFVVRATRQEQVKVAQDTRLSPSTRKHLLGELQLLEREFEVNSPA
jgi:hypothetical protein